MKNKTIAPDILMNYYTNYFLSEIKLGNFVYNQREDYIKFWENVEL